MRFRNDIERKMNNQSHRALSRKPFSFSFLLSNQFKNRQIRLTHYSFSKGLVNKVLCHILESPDTMQNLISSNDYNLDNMIHAYNKKTRLMNRLILERRYLMIEFLGIQFFIEARRYKSFAKTASSSLASLSFALRIW